MAQKVRPTVTNATEGKSAFQNAKTGTAKARTGTNLCCRLVDEDPHIPLLRTSAASLGHTFGPRTTASAADIVSMPAGFISCRAPLNADTEHNALCDTKDATLNHSQHKEPAVLHTRTYTHTVYIHSSSRQSFSFRGEQLESPGPLLLLLPLLLGVRGHK